MRPYLEVKVVKVKKSNKDNNICPECGQPFDMKKKGDWVNGENLDKIKFPCFCSYLSGIGERYCELDVVKSEYRVSELIQTSREDHHARAKFHNKDLGDLMRYLNLKIIKGKIILFEEE